MNTTPPTIPTTAMIPYHPDNEPLLKALVAVIGTVFFIGLLTTLTVFGLGIWKLIDLLNA